MENTEQYIFMIKFCKYILDITTVSLTVEISLTVMFNKKLALEVSSFPVIK